MRLFGIENTVVLINSETLGELVFMKHSEVLLMKSSEF